MVKYLTQNGFRFIITAILSSVLLSACSANDNSHTTVSTVVTPPRRQELTVVTIPPTQPPSDKSRSSSEETKVDHFVPSNAAGVDPSKPLLIVKTPSNGQTFRTEGVVPVDFLILNAKLKDDGGEYRLRYFVDDDDPRWLDNPIPFGLAGWLPGPHRIRLELIGPDGWPYRNGNQNIVTREITVSTQ